MPAPQRLSLLSFSLLILLLLLAGGCGPRRQNVERSFYEWRSRIFYSPADIAALDSLQVTSLYVRFFDVQWDDDKKMPVPESVAQFISPLPPGKTIIPTVYITNDVVRRVNRDAIIQDLARNIREKIEQVASEAKSTSFSEVQIDCDWTASSQLNYFELLRQIRDVFPGITVSATIRLHQIKYRAETGVPPVERGMLMAYNVGDVVSPKETNSIFTAEEVDKYLGTLDDYPLPLDAALPVFSWGVRFHFNRFASLINNVTEQDMKGRNEFRMVDKNVWMAGSETMLRGERVYPGDIIRIEQPDHKGVLEVAQTISRALNSPTIAVALYRFDPEIIARSTPEDFHSIFRMFEPK